MECAERFAKYRGENFDKVLLHIKTGIIKTGRYAGRIKLDKCFKLKRKEELFNEHPDE